MTFFNNTNMHNRGGKLISKVLSVRDNIAEKINMGGLRRLLKPMFISVRGTLLR